MRVYSENTQLALLTNTKEGEKNILVAPFDVCPVFSYCEEMEPVLTEKNFYFAL
jgi:hypothetical protein